MGFENIEPCKISADEILLKALAPMWRSPMAGNPATMASNHLPESGIFMMDPKSLLSYNLSAGRAYFHKTYMLCAKNSTGGCEETIISHSGPDGTQGRTF